jgi:hypothetical protein
MTLFLLILMVLQKSRTQTIFSPDFPASDEGDGFAVKPDTWRGPPTTSNPVFGRRFGSQNGNRIGLVVNGKPQRCLRTYYQDVS